MENNRMDVSGLKKTVITLALQGRDARQVIRETTHRDRDKAWVLKRRIGCDAREAFLAYAYARGVPYRSVEPVTHSRVEASAIAACFRNAGLSPRDANDIQSWMDLPEDPERATERAEKLKAWFARRDAARASARRGAA